MLRDGFLIGIVSRWHRASLDLRGCAYISFSFFLIKATKSDSWGLHLMTLLQPILGP
jgi:hypothetical protein